MENSNPVKEKNANELKEFFKKWPGFYYFIYDYLGPVYLGGLGPKNFLKKYPTEGLSLNLGSGARRIVADIVNVDFKKYSSVDVVADITKLPYENSSVSRIICDQVLEHVSEYQKAVDEIERVLEKRGVVYISTPFLYPFHASPTDFQRWTLSGLTGLFKNFEVIESGIRSGPFSTLCTYLCYLSASLFCFGNEKIYWTIVYVSTLVFFPIRYLDFVGNHLPFANHMSTVIYCVLRKK